MVVYIYEKTSTFNMNNAIEDAIKSSNKSVKLTAIEVSKVSSASIKDKGE